jgi:putative methionine-R-sulfoxide reductase with GAF domain
MPCPRPLNVFGGGEEAIFPIRDPDQTFVGTIDVESEQINAFTAEDHRFLEQCAVTLAALWG